MGPPSAVDGGNFPDLAKVKVECTLVEDTAAGEAYTSVCLEHKSDAQLIYHLVELLKLDSFKCTAVLPGCGSGSVYSLTSAQ
jgi:hypothetical protein